MIAIKAGKDLSQAARKARMRRKKLGEVHEVQNLHERKREHDEAQPQMPRQFQCGFEHCSLMSHFMSRVRTDQATYVNQTITI
jgi:hypothetical protein